ncbi:MAG TPA: toll/interleukin-1 receptor domain-containing protein [Mycobacterium sp.]
MATVFVSYARADGAQVEALVEDLRADRQDVWLDQRITGGDLWWSSILEHIRTSTVFVFAMSQNSLHSKPCQAERDYASDLGLPILPVLVGDVESDMVDELFNVQWVDYRKQTSSAGIALSRALRQKAAQRADLPDPLPPAPPIPYEYLQRIGKAIRGTRALSSEEQKAFVHELTQSLLDEDDEQVRARIRDLLTKLRKRREATTATTGEIEIALMQEAEEPSEPRASSRQLPGWLRGRWVVGAAAAILVLIAGVVAAWLIVGGDQTHETTWFAAVQGADARGFKDFPKARCEGEDRAVFIMRTEKSMIAICRSGTSLYYRGYAMINQNGITLNNVVPEEVNGGIDYIVTNPTDGTRYEVRRKGLTVLQPGQAPWFERCVQYAEAA